MSQPLTDAINSLITYSNSVTGQSDQTLSEAVATLANGYKKTANPTFVTCLISNGTQFISSEIPRAVTGSALWVYAKIRFAITETGNTTTIPFGCGDWNQIVINNGNIRLDTTGNTSTPTVAWQANTIYEYIETNGGVSVNGTSFNATARTTNRSYFDYRWGIFARNYGGVINSNAKIKLYEFTADNGQRTVHLLPCLDGDGVACLWDTVGEKYYYNVTGQPFTYEQ